MTSAKQTPSAKLGHDLDLVHSVTRLLNRADNVDPSAVQVRALDGCVTLTGKVATHAERLAAGHHAASAEGVVSVENLLRVRDLEVGSGSLPDAEVAEGVARAVIQSTVGVDDLKFDVRQHVVTLRGQVATKRDKAALRHAVHHVPGVHFVVDLIEVEHDPAEAVEELEPAECLRLLAASSVGRLAVHDQSGIDVFPVNYLLHENAIYFRSGAGAKMIRLTDAPHVAFEVDGREGLLTWSVVVRGVAHRLDSDAEILASGISESPSAHPSEKLNFVRIRPQQISGRRFRTSRGRK